MTTQAALIRRLRRLTDDVGHGYSQSAPGFSVDLTAQTAPLRIGLQIDADLAPADVTIGLPAVLATGQAIAMSLQSVIRALAPTNVGYANCLVTFDRQDGYIIRSGSTGTGSLVRVTPPTAGTNVATLLKLGQVYGGYETPPRFGFSDDEMGELLDEALALQNSIGTPTVWEYATIPPPYETLVVYRAWSSIVDMRLGQSAAYHWQRVKEEESHEEQVFSNYLKLADWLKKKLDELQADLDGSDIIVTTASRWDYQTQQFVPTEVFDDQSLTTAILTATWENATTAIIELGEILSTGFVEINIGYRKTTPGVIDRAIYNATDYESAHAALKGFEPPSVLARTLRNGRNTLLRITGLDDNEDTYFAAMAVDVDGHRYFSNELKLTAAP